MSFRHDETGTPESLWHRQLADRDVPVVAIDRPRRVAVVAAHPDDETLGAAGLMAAVSDAGGSVVVVVASDGEASHPRSPTWRSDALATERRRELRLAVSRVAPAGEVVFLGVPDGHVAEHVDVLAAAVRTQHAELVVAPWRRDGHPDHEAAGLAAAVASADRGTELWEYPIWYWHWGGDDVEALPWHNVVRLDLTDAQHRLKQQAMADHRTQVAPLSPAAGDEVLLGEHVLGHFRRRFETFVRSGLTRLRSDTRSDSGD